MDFRQRCGLGLGELVVGAVAAGLVTTGVGITSEGTMGAGTTAWECVGTTPTGPAKFSEGCNSGKLGEMVSFSAISTSGAGAGADSVGVLLVGICSSGSGSRDRCGETGSRGVPCLFIG